MDYAYEIEEIRPKQWRVATTYNGIEHVFDCIVAVDQSELPALFAYRMNEIINPHQPDYSGGGGNV